MLIASGNDILKYGLPVCRGTSPYTYVTEPSFAKLYWLDHMRQAAPVASKRKAKLEDEFEAHVWALGRFMLDYLLQTCMGEARHHTQSAQGTADCAVCQKHFGSVNSNKDRTVAADLLSEKFTSYDEAITAVNHIFWDHTWSKGMGGWLWGNIAWICHSLNQAFEHRSINEMVHWLDVISGITHNGACCLNSKFSFYQFSGTTFNRILWAKFHGEPCCINYLEAMWRRRVLEPYDAQCIHAKSKGRGSQINAQPVLRPGMEPKWLCKRCVQPKRVYYELDPLFLLCRTYCRAHQICNCVCYKKMKPFELYTKCNECNYNISASTFMILTMEGHDPIKLGLCSTCGRLQRINLPVGIRFISITNANPSDNDE